MYTRWLSEGKRCPDLGRTLAYMTKAHDNNRCHEHGYDKLDDFVRRTYERACERASDEGYSESQARKGRLRAEQLWAPLRGAIVDRNRSIIAARTAGTTRSAVAEAFGISTRTVSRITTPLLRPRRALIPQGGGIEG